MKARSVRVAGIEIIDSVKTVAFVFTETGFNRRFIHL